MEEDGAFGKQGQEDMLKDSRVFHKRERMEEREI